MKVFTNLKNSKNTVRNSKENGKSANSGFENNFMPKFWKILNSFEILRGLWAKFCWQNACQRCWNRTVTLWTTFQFHKSSDLGFQPPKIFENTSKIFIKICLRPFSKYFPFSLEFLTVLSVFFRFVKTFIRIFNFWN